LVSVSAQGKHRYYTLQGAYTASALEALSVLAGAPRSSFVPTAPHGLRAARTCYDHIAGSLGVSLHDRFLRLGWLRKVTVADAYELTPGGENAFAALDLDLKSAKASRRRFAFPCVDWSERRPHLGGALPAAFLGFALRRKWLLQDCDSRALTVTRAGRRELLSRFGMSSDWSNESGR